MTEVTILMVTDDPDQRELFTLVLTSRRWHVDAVGDAESALQHLSEQAYDILLTDYELPMITGSELIQRVGPTGRVIGVDMTPEMISKARQNAEVGSYTNVEFRLGEIEALPVADNTADVIISNCVINLSPEKSRVFREAYRALKPGGRLAISDVVATAELPAAVLNDMAMLCGCVSGASTVEEIEVMLSEAGFQLIVIEPLDASRSFIREWAPGRNVEDYVVSASITASKPL